MSLFFAGEIFDLSRFFSVLIGVISFSLVASSIYIINDIIDVKFDKLHPEKCKRPIASGEISVLNAFLLFLICLFIAIVSTSGAPINLS
ncbi:UbiA family prenyltransferase [Chitinophaga sancti]|uniref:UbiA family prenyltransferase n=1 Tax=Chitinophaga sancti TaxID=1004 RepID=UPI003904693D